ncbi:MAG: response regulator [Elusimicrobia bacterium]|nr:response regulator [Elusimicrobiota bacterium]
MRVAYLREGAENWPTPGGPPAAWKVALFDAADALVSALLGADFDAVLLALPSDADRLTDVLSRVRAAAPDAPVLVAASARRETEAEAGVAAGAADYWLDTMSPRRLSFALEREAFRRRGAALRRAASAASGPPASAGGADARRLFEGILNALSAPVFVKDRGHRVLFVNDAFCALLGRSREDILARGENGPVPAVQGQALRRQDDLVFESGGENVHQEVLTDEHGLAHVLVTRKTVWRDAGGRPYLVGVIRDITDLVKAVEDLKRSQEALRRARKLETVGRLAGGIAHDFNNVLTAIAGCANLLLEALPPDHAAREEALEICRAGERASDLTRQLLLFARRPEGRPQALDLRELYGGMRKMLARLLPARIELDFRFPDRLGSVRVDPGCAEQVLLNLAVNAADAMPEGGRVIIELADVDAGPAGLAGPCVRLSVCDDGVGMDEPTRAAIFEPFFTTKPEGTGLGLATVRGAVTDSGGAVVVESLPDRGSTFRVFWPRCSRDDGAQPVRRPQKAGRPPRRARVLVVEDDDAVRRFVVRSLERAGHEVLAAADGLAALRLCGEQKAPVDVAVVDVILPRLLGPEFVERLRERQPGAKILYVSGQLSDPAVQACTTSGRGAFLPKPFDASLLAQRVSALLAEPDK